MKTLMTYDAITTSINLGLTEFYVRPEKWKIDLSNKDDRKFCVDVLNNQLRLIELHSELTINYMADTQRLCQTSDINRALITLTKEDHYEER